MAIPQSGITTTLVGQAIGLGSNDVGTLCTSTKINPWSRYKPGYLYADSNKYIQFQLPRGMGYADPRGSYLGRTDEGYNLGDFKGYNHQATAPNTPAQLETITYGSSDGGQSATRQIPFYIGEIDWQGTESSTHNAEQILAIPFPYAHLVVSGSIVGSADISSISQNGSVDIPLNYTTPAKGNSTTLNYEVYLGIDSTHFNVRVGTLVGANSVGSFTVITLNSAQITGVSWDSSSISGGDTPPYNGFYVTNQSNFFTSPNILNYEFPDTAPFAVENGDSQMEYFKKITADCYIKGFYSSPDTLYSVGNMSFLGKNADNQITLPVGGSPSTYGDGDVLTLVLSNINLIY